VRIKQYLGSKGSQGVSKCANAICKPFQTSSSIVQSRVLDCGDPGLVNFSYQAIRGLVEP
jgi:hypothetical protein